MEKTKYLIQKISDSVYIEHEDVTKCGQCWKEKIKSEVAKEMIVKNQFNDNSFSELFEEVDRRWRKTSLYLRVKRLLDSGKTMNQVKNELHREGIDI